MIVLTDVLNLHTKPETFGELIARLQGMKLRMVGYRRDELHPDDLERLNFELRPHGVRVAGVLLNTVKIVPL